ncbi:MAG: hypothetical protein JNM76_08375 [Betaproteobacteria bacterium]|nr:hypothetical protein [Betaproteobacteria bacterium]
MFTCHGTSWLRAHTIATLFAGCLFALPCSAQSHFTLDVLAGDSAPGALPKAAYAELVAHLDDTLAARFTLRVMTTRRHLEASLSGATAPHFVLTDGVIPFSSRDYTVLHTSPERLTAVLLVPHASTIRSLQDLQGKKLLANREHAVTVLGTRLLSRHGVDAQLGGGNHFSEEALARHYAQFPGRDALLTSLSTAEALMTRHPDLFRLLPERESAPRWVLAGRAALPEGVNEGLLASLQATSGELSPASRKLLPAFKRPPRETLTAGLGR